MAVGNPLVRVLVAVSVLGGCGTSRGSTTAAPAEKTTASARAANRAVVSAKSRVADVRLPHRADAPATIVDRATQTRVAFELMGARPVAATPRNGVTTFPAAGPDGSEVRFRASQAGAEDFIDLPTKPAREEVRYRVNVGDAAGLRLVENVLELVDAAGVPRLRMDAPYVTDGKGRHDARVTLADCAADRDTAGPWRRAVTAPGRRECVVRIAWGGRGDPIEYPAVLDPAWTATKGTMTRPRRGHSATLLASGSVLIAGGESVSGTTTTYEKTAELFDPTTNTFAATGSMAEGQSFHGAARLSTGDVVVAGGNGASGVLASSEVYDAGTSKFHTVSALIVARAEAGLTAFGTAGALVAGGVDGTGTVLDTSELFDSVGEAWSAADRMSERRLGAYLTTVPTGEAIIVGGTTTTAIGDLASGERFTLAGGWTSLAGLASPRHDFAGATFTGGKILVAGGYQASVAKVLATAELLDANETGWTAAGTLHQARTLHTLTALADGAAVAVGGVTRDAKGKISTYLKSAELFDPTTSTWTALADLTEARSSHTATLLADGRVLVAGGESAAGQSDTAELLTLDAAGVACTSASTCAAGFCADGVCCKTACDTACMACALAITGQPSGTCAPVEAGKDPRSDCADDGAPACTKDGLCDGTGACESYATTKCAPKSCATGTDCTSGFCSDGICCDNACSGACEACTALKKGSGGDGTCGPVKASTDPDGDCGQMGTGVCAGNGTCDGAGACHVPTAGKACAPAACVDTETLGAAAKCSTAGDCTPVTTSCAPFLCDAVKIACETSCNGDSDCALGAHCKGGLCARGADGTTCTKTTDCTSGFCADGVCCDTACGGQCEACDGTDSPGTCKPVTDLPHGTRTPCDGTAPCTGQCNGLLTTGCVYPGDETTCSSTGTCSAGTGTADRCNGLGACVSTPTTCLPYACGASACNTTCSKNGDCADGYQCRGSTCVFTGSTSCADGSTESADGGACHSPGANGGATSGGCGCRMAGRGSSAPEGLGALVLAVASFSRRRRRGAAKENGRARTKRA